MSVSMAWPSDDDCRRTGKIFVELWTSIPRCIVGSLATAVTEGWYSVRHFNITWPRAALCRTTRAIRFPTRDLRTGDESVCGLRSAEVSRSTSGQHNLQNVADEVWWLRIRNVSSASETACARVRFHREFTATIVHLSLWPPGRVITSQALESLIYRLLRHVVRHAANSGSAEWRRILCDADLLSKLQSGSEPDFVTSTHPFPTTRHQHSPTRLITKSGGAVAVCACANVKYGGPRHGGMPGRQWRRPSQFLLRSDIAFNKFSAILRAAYGGKCTSRLRGTRVEEEKACDRPNRWTGMLRNQRKWLTNDA